jgi:hypothetical protein
MECKNFVFAGRYGWLPAKSYDFALHKKTIWKNTSVPWGDSSGVSCLLGVMGLIGR